MKRRAPQSDVVIRLFDEEWQQWEFAEGLRERLPNEAATNGSLRTLAVPARHVLASPLWIDGTDAALTSEAAKLELEVRGLLSRAQGMEGVTFRFLPEEDRTLAVAAVFPAELPTGFPSAERFDGSPFLFELPRDAATLWREGEDYVAAFTRAGDVVYWETIDHSVNADEVRTWLSLIVLRLEGEGVLTAPPRVVSWVEGLAVDRIAPPGCLPAAELAGGAGQGIPVLERRSGDWKPISVHAADVRRNQRERMRALVLAVVAGYIVLATALFIYAGVLRWKAAGMRATTARLQAEVAQFQPTAADWTSIGPTAEPSQYPLELLRGVIAAMPPGGVRLTKFILEGGHLSIEGEADDFGVARAFQNSLEASADLKGISWELPTPKVETVKTSFQAMGTLPALTP